jgi:hypothetical protein
MRWSLIGKLTFFALASVSLALGKYPPVVSGITLSVVLVAAWFVAPTATWRRLAYGSVFGIVLTYCVLLAIVFIRLGRLSSSNYQESNAVHEITEPWRTYIVPVGALFGVSVAVAQHRLKHLDVYGSQSVKPSNR